MSETETNNLNPETEVVETDAEETPATIEAAPAEEVKEEVKELSEPKVDKDYLAASILSDIQTVTVDQLEAMEASDQKSRDIVMEELVKESIGDIREDHVIKGRVIGTNDREVLVDIGFKSEGVVPREDFGPEGLPTIGDEISIYLVRLEDHNGQTVLSKEKADFMGRWVEIHEKAESGETIMGRITRRIKGGMIVDLNGVPAFLPGSQIDIRPVQDFDAFIGQEFEFKIVKLNESRKNIVLSRKELLQADMMEKRTSLIADLHVDQVLEGRVKNITDFGVFVDLGGLDGLLHITDLSWGRVSHPSEIVQLDQTIEVKVIDFDPEKQRVSLGLKQLQPHPWESVDVNYPLGSTITGKVVSMTNYGAFIEIEKGVEGLVHVSEMSWTRHVRHPSEMFTLGEEIEAKILNLDVEDRKISLGVKQLQPDPWDKIEEKYQVGTVQHGVVRNLTQFGAFVELEEGVDGLIHITDLSWTRNLRHPKEALAKGAEIKVRVLDVSRENRRIALGLKQISEDPWNEIEAFYTAGKQVKGEVFRVLDKGVILNMDMDMEGIIPLRDIPKRDRKNAVAHLNPGDVLEVTVQEISLDEKKIILMSDVLSRGEAAIIESSKAPASEAPAEDAAPETPVKAGAPAEEAPSEEIAAEEAPVEEVAHDTAAEAETPAEEAPSEEIAAEEAPVEEVAPDTAAEAETPTEEAPSEEIAAEEAPIEEVAPDTVVEVETPAEEVPSDQVAAEEAPAEEPAPEAVEAKKKPAKKKAVAKKKTATTKKTAAKKTATKTKTVVKKTPPKKTKAAQKAGSAGDTDAATEVGGK